MLSQAYRRAIEEYGPVSDWCTDTQDTTRNRWGCGCGNLLVDLNGSESKPNIDGVDLFGFKIFTDGISPQGTRYDNYWYPYTFEEQCAGNQITSIGRGMCTAWVLENNNLDYLRCPKELGGQKHHLVLNKAAPLSIEFYKSAVL